MSTPWLSRPEKPEEMGEKIKLARRFHENITCLFLKKNIPLSFLNHINSYNLNNLYRNCLSIYEISLSKCKVFFFLICSYGKRVHVIVISDPTIYKLKQHSVRHKLLLICIVFKIANRT